MVQGFPFTAKKDAVHQGLTIAVWEAMAHDHGWSFHYLEADRDTDRAVQQLAQGQFDVLIGPLAVTVPRIQQVDFTTPFFINAIGLMVPKKHVSFSSITKVLKTAGFWSIITGFIGLFFLYLHLIWYFERGKLNELPLSYRQAITGA